MKRMIIKILLQCALIINVQYILCVSTCNSNMTKIPFLVFPDFVCNLSFCRNFENMPLIGSSHKSQIENALLPCRLKKK